MFGDGDRDAVGINFLERIGADHRRRDLAGDTNQRDGVEARIGDGGDQVGRARPATGHADCRFALCARHTLRDKTCALFVTGQYMADLRALA
ncbi:hypothetical protein D3C80_1906080 [compost metagenome]